MIEDPSPSSSLLFPPQPSARREPPEGFAEFWAVYPRKVSKQGAMRQFRMAVRRGHSPAFLLGEATRWAGLWERAGTAKNFILHSVTWLADERWADEEPGVETVARTVWCVGPCGGVIVDGSPVWHVRSGRLMCRACWAL